MIKPPFDSSSLFGQELPIGGLYCGVVLQQRLDLIEHLLEFGRQLILLSGVKGAGKSTLLHAVGEKTSDHWQCIVLAAGPHLGADALLAKIAAELDIEDGHDDNEIRLDNDDDSSPTPGAGELLDAIRQRITELDRTGVTVVLIVDDADQLRVETVGALLALARTEEPLAEARVLMAAVPEHTALLAALQRDHGQHGLVHVVEIPPLADDQIGPFLQQRMGAAGERLDDWLDPDEVMALGAEAQGNPGALVALARQALAGREPRAPGGMRLRGGNANSGDGIAAQLVKLRAMNGPLKWAALLALPLAAIAWFLFNSPFQGSPAALPPPPEPASAAAPAGPEPVPPSVASKTVQLDGGRQRIEIELPPPTATTVRTPAEPMSTAPEAEAVEEARPAAPEPKAHAAPPAPTPMPAVKPATVPPPAPKSAPSREKPVAAKSAAPARPVEPAKPTARPEPKPAPKPVATPGAARSGYTLQLFGVSTRSAATNFIARHALGGSARIIDTQRNRKPWFILTYGNYPSRTSAQNAAARLPPAVQREVEPWVRDVKSLNALPR